MASARYAVELKPGVGVASFMAGGTAVELSDENPRFETDDASEYLGVRELPFLKDLGEVKAAKAGAAE
jgi:hypothetical protein